MRVFSPKQLVQELRRRRVFSTVALYILGAWVALQVAELAFPAIPRPEEAIRWIWLGAFLLFPLVLVFGWRYDIGKAGIQRTAPSEDQEADTDLQKSDRWFIGSLATVALGVVGMMLIEIGQMEPDESFRVLPVENSIAVMPFGVCESRTSDLPLAGGITGEVIERLSARDRLNVIGRTTAYNLAGIDTSSQQIAELTGAKYILNGALCRDGFDLTLEAELTNRDGFIEWRESFKEEVNQFDQVEQQLATLVANGVARELGDVIQDPLNNPINKQALWQLRIGQGHHWEDEWEQAREAYNKALEYQPDLVEAVWGLAWLQIDQGGLHNFGTILEQARPLTEKALELALMRLERGVPDFKAHSIAGEILSVMAIFDEELIWRSARDLDAEELQGRNAEVRAQYEEGEQHLRAAIALNPVDDEVRGWLVENLDRQGIHRSAEALEILEQARELDPFNTDFAKELSYRLAARGQFRQAMEVLDRFDALPPDSRPAIHHQLEISSNNFRYDEKLSRIIRFMANEPEVGPAGWALGHFSMLTGDIASLGLHEEAEELYGLVKDIPFGGRGIDWQEILEILYLWAAGQYDELLDRHLPKIEELSDEEILDRWGVDVYLTIKVLWFAGHKERAIALSEAYRHDQKSPRWVERQTEVTIELAEYYIDTGRSEEALVLLDEAIDHLETEVDAGIRHPLTLGLLANAHGLRGDEEAALEALDRAVNYGWWELLLWMEDEAYSESWKWWITLQDNPDFIQSLNRMQSIRDQQASNVQGLLAQYDMELLLEPTIEAVIEGLNQDD
jgi:TolB-like protein/Flp pilus assembly protein TadD